jgi:hypothetical protein
VHPLQQFLTSANSLLMLPAFVMNLAIRQVASIIQGNSPSMDCRAIYVIGEVSCQNEDVNELSIQEF